VEGKKIKGIGVLTLRAVGRGIVLNRGEEFFAALRTVLGRLKDDPCSWRKPLSRWLQGVFPYLESLEPMLGDFLELSDEWELERQDQLTELNYIWLNLSELFVIGLAIIRLSTCQLKQSICLRLKLRTLPDLSAASSCPVSTIVAQDTKESNSLLDDCSNTSPPPAVPSPGQLDEDTFLTP
jgi:hypothetical protein